MITFLLTWGRCSKRHLQVFYRKHCVQNVIVRLIQRSKYACINHGVLVLIFNYHNVLVLSRSFGYLCYGSNITMI